MCEKENKFWYKEYQKRVRLTEEFCEQIIHAVESGFAFTSENVRMKLDELWRMGVNKFHNKKDS